MRFLIKPALLAVAVCSTPTATYAFQAGAKAEFSTVTAGLSVGGLILTGCISYGASNSKLLKKGLSLVGIGKHEAGAVAAITGGFLSISSIMPAFALYGYLAPGLWLTGRVITSRAFLGSLQRAPVIKEIFPESSLNDITQLSTGEGINDGGVDGSGNNTDGSGMSQAKSSSKSTNLTSSDRSDRARAAFFVATALTAAAWKLVKFGLKSGFNYPQGILKIHFGLIEILKGRLS